MFLPEGARHLASVPPPAPLPTMMTSKRLSMVTPLETNAAMHDASVCEDGGRGYITRAVAGEESDDVRNLLRARHAPERYGRIELREFSRIGHCAEIDTALPLPQDRLQQLESCGWRVRDRRCA